MTRKIINFFKAPIGRFLLFLLAVIIFVLAFSYYRNRPAKENEKTKSFNDSISIERAYERFRNEYEVLKNASNTPVKTRHEHKLDEKDKENKDLEKKVHLLEKALLEEKAAKTLIELQSPIKAPENKPPRKLKVPYSPVSLFTAKALDEKEETDTNLNEYAPFGRLIKCQLVNTVDSSSFETPIIALVTENLWHKGRIIIPAGTEVHGKAESLTQRNRIAAEKNWILVWRTKTSENGFEMPLTANALDYERDPATGHFSMTDGSAGLKGDIIETTEYSKLKLYAALFIKGAADGLSELITEEARSNSQNTFINSSASSEESSQDSNDDQLKAGLAKGISQAIDLYTQNMLDAISRDGVFVRVPAGRSFYLYVTQTIDKSRAFPGAAIGLEKPDSPPKEINREEDAQALLLSLARKRLLEENQKSKEKDDE